MPVNIQYTASMALRSLAPHLLGLLSSQLGGVLEVAAKDLKLLGDRSKEAGELSTVKS